MTQGQASQKAYAIVGQPFPILIRMYETHLLYFAPIVEECNIIKYDNKYHVEAQLYDLKEDKVIHVGIL